MTIALALPLQSIFTRVVWVVIFGVIAYYGAKSGWFKFESVERFAKVLDTTGGKILILVILTMVFFSSAIGYGYYVMEALEQKTLTPDNALVNLLIQFVTGTAFGSSLGALISLLGSGKDKQ